MSVYQRKGRKGWFINLMFKGVRINRWGGKTKKEAKETEEEIRTKLRLKMLSISDIKKDEMKISFDEVATEYLAHVKDSKSKRTYELEQGDYDNHLKKFFSRYTIDAIDNALLLQFQALQKRRGFANRTVNIHVGTVRKIRNFAVEKEYVDDRKLMYPMLREPKKLHAFLSPEEYRKLKQHVSYDMALKRIVFGRQTGMRPAELTYLAWTDIDFNLKTAKIQSKKEWKVKTDEERIIPLNKVALRILEALHQRIKGKWVFSNTSKPVKSIRGSLSTAARKAGITKNVTPNMLRHTFATHTLLKGADIKSVMEIMGHKNLETTNKYLHAINEACERTVELLEEDESEAKIISIEKHEQKKKSA